MESGTITYDGIDIRRIRKDDLRHSLAMVIQETHLFTGTIADNIRYGKLDATDEEVREAARIANADSFIRRLPDGYDTMLYSDGSNLSQGQRQLIAIARAAIAKPPVLILDEATSSIDTRTERLIEKGMDGRSLLSPTGFPRSVIPRLSWCWRRVKSSSGAITKRCLRTKEGITSCIPDSSNWNKLGER